MLTYLKIKNFAIIEEIELELKDGMSVITGETGAGKSLLIDTLGLALGDRADSSMLKDNANRSEITAIFEINNLPTVQKWLNYNGFSASDDENNVCVHECIVYRTFNKEGRSRSSINGIACTLQTVKELGNHLVDLHGQHEHHSLLKTETQRNLLDAYANNEKLLHDLKQLYSSWQKMQKELSTLEEETKDRASKIDLLNYQIQEFSNLAIPVKELENVKKEHHLLSNAEEIIKNCQTVLAIASEKESDNILANLNNAKNLLFKVNDKINDAKLDNICQLWESAKINIEESINELRHYLDHVELNQERLSWLEKNLQSIYTLAHKHKVKPDELPQIHETLKIKLQELTTADEKLKKLHEQINEITSNYHELAEKISQSRYNAAQKLNKEVTSKMQQLGMPHGKFNVKIIANATKQPSPYGFENIEFEVSANLGQSLQPLNKVASGGELSRISLALQVILADKSSSPSSSSATAAATLIFDEVDVGIGGKTAEIVGSLLSQLSKNNQVICVTHLPQVASFGKHHLQIIKYVDSENQTTKLKLANLTKKERINEIARMLGGIDITKHALAHAQEMLEKNH